MRLSIQTPPRCAVAALPLLAGVALGFVGCTLAGRLVSRRNPFDQFTSFHQWISPQSLFYPTPHQLQALGRSRFRRDKVAILVGGNSVLRGTGQRPRNLWTRYLQEELGDGYRVLNLAMDGAYAAEFGGTAAEILTRDFPKLIFVTNASPHRLGSCPPLSPQARAAAIPYEFGYGYLFWEAYFQGLLALDETRRAAIAGQLAERATRASFQVKNQVNTSNLLLAVGERARTRNVPEEVRGMRVDRLLHSRDLWTTLGYNYLSTVWVPLLPAPFTRPRRTCPELIAASLWAEQIRAWARSPVALKQSLADLRGQIALGKDFSRRLARGESLDQNSRLLVPPVLHGRTLMVVPHDNPRFVMRLTPSEQAEYRSILVLLCRELERVGFAAVEAGSHYTETDYLDRCHLNESGGRKLATEVAEAVRRLARRLGYAQTELPRLPLVR